MLDVVLVDHPLEVPARAEDGYGQPGLLERLFVEEADREQPELGVLDEAAGGQAADAAGADDQRGPGELPIAAGFELCPAERHAPGGEVDGAERKEANGLRGEVLDLARQEDPEREHDHRGERGHREHRAHVVEHLQADAPRVEPAEVERNQDDRAVGREPDR